MRSCARARLAAGRSLLARHPPGPSRSNRALRSVLRHGSAARQPAPRRAAHFSPRLWPRRGAAPPAFRGSRERRPSASQARSHLRRQNDTRVFRTNEDANGGHRGHAPPERPAARPLLRLLPPRGGVAPRRLLGVALARRRRRLPARTRAGIKTVNERHVTRRSAVGCPRGSPLLPGESTAAPLWRRVDPVPLPAPNERASSKTTIDINVTSQREAGGPPSTAPPARPPFRGSLPGASPARAGERPDRHEQPRPSRHGATTRLSNQPRDARHGAVADRGFPLHSGGVARRALRRHLRALIDAHEHSLVHTRRPRERLQLRSIAAPQSR